MTWGALKTQLRGLFGADTELSRSASGPFTTVAVSHSVGGPVVTWPPGPRLGGYCIQHDVTFTAARCPYCHDRDPEPGRALDRLLLEEARAQRWYETGLTHAEMIRARWPDALPDFPCPKLTLRPEGWPDEPTEASLRALRFDAAVAAATELRLETYFRRNAHWILASLPVHHFRGQLQVIWPAQGAC